MEAIVKKKVPKRKNVESKSKHGTPSTRVEALLNAGGEEDSDIPVNLGLKRLSETPNSAYSGISTTTPGTLNSAASSWNLNSYAVALIEYRNRRQVRI
jgi:hypothetical protein